MRQDAIHVGLLDTQNRIPFATVSDDLVNLTEVGAYAQNTTRWTNWLRTVAGLRSADSGTIEPNGASKRYSLEWDNHMIANRWLLLDANMAWTHARYATMNDNGTLGNLIPNAVSKVALIAATAHQGSWSGSVETRYIGSYPLTQDGSLLAPSAIVTNVQIQHELSRNLSVQLDVLNFFNREYYDIAYAQDYQMTPTSPLVPSGITAHPGEPRELRLAAKLKF